MNARKLSPLFLLGGALWTGLLLTRCGEGSTAPEAVEDAEPGPASAAVQTGETFKSIAITNPTTTTFGMGVGGSYQMRATLYYSLGGTRDGVPYTAWSAVDPCITSVTSVSPSWGLAKGVKAGSTLVIATAFGKSDTVKVTVTGIGNTDPTCETRIWTFNFADASFTTIPKYTIMPLTGETLTRIVLFGWKDTLLVGATRDLRSEMQYTGVGRLNGELHGVKYFSTDGRVATVDPRTGAVRAVASGRTRMIVSLGTGKTDTVPVYVR